MSGANEQEPDIIHIQPFDDRVESARKDTFTQLQDYIIAQRPLIYICDYDFATIDSMVKAIAEQDSNGMKREIEEFVGGVGPLENFDAKRVVNQEQSLSDWLLNRLEEQNCLKCDKILLLKNVHNELRGDGGRGGYVASILRQIAGRGLDEFGEGQRNYRLFVVIVSPERVIPPELERLICFLTVGKPSEEEILAHLRESLKDTPFYPEEEALKQAALKFRGLSILEVDLIVNLACARSEILGSDDANKTILREKKQLVEKSGLLKIVETGKNEIGGLENLKRHLENEKRIYGNLLKAKEAGVPIPKGVLIVGVPGCGKSLAAKFTARLFGVPLICLDLGKLMGPYVGQSEANMRRALETVEAAAPCVLWIDEIEKAFAGVGSEGTIGGSEVTTRLFGSFLTWMQEKQDSVYVVATANHIERLPTELKRRGRFDEIFWVGLPTKKERAEIFRVKFEGRSNLDAGIDFEALAARKKGFSGSDIEAIVGNVIKKAFLEEKQFITQEMLEEEIEKMIPLEDKLKKEMELFEKHRKEYNFTPASEEA